MTDQEFKIDDPGYPKLLKEIHGPPSVLYVKGDLPDLKHSIAIVGTRRSSHYGEEIAHNLAKDLSILGFTIVSGMASGIDTAAHKGALEAGGKTIAVLGCGVDVIYPLSNTNLYHQIIESGAVISELPNGTGTARWTFPRRNRIISGLSKGVIIVEGGYKSGAMITAKLALDQGREVFAVPGNIKSELSKGPHWLIKQGAKLVESIEDVLEEFNMLIPEDRGSNAENRQLALTENLTDEEQQVIKSLSYEPVNIDQLALESGFTAQKTSGILMVLEVKNLIKKIPGNLFIAR